MQRLKRNAESSTLIQSAPSTRRSVARSPTATSLRPRSFRCSSSSFYVEAVTTKLNYGINSARFPAPVPVGPKIRLAARLAKVTGITGECSS